MNEKRFAWKTEKLQHSDDEVLLVVDNANKDWKGHILNIVDLLNELCEENEQLRQIIKDIVCATDETYTKNTSMFKVTVVFDGKMYNQIRSCLYE